MLNDEANETQAAGMDEVYPEVDVEELGEWYMLHVNAMTRENLHGKHLIAAQLAWRDREIATLRAERTAISAKPSPTAAPGQFVPTPHEPVEGVTLWNARADAMWQSCGAAIRIDALDEGFIGADGRIVPSNKSLACMVPHTMTNLEQFTPILVTFRDRIRAERAARLAAQPADKPKCDLCDDTAWLKDRRGEVCPRCVGMDFVWPEPSPAPALAASGGDTQPPINPMTGRPDLVDVIEHRAKRRTGLVRELMEEAAACLREHHTVTLTVG